jgi:hypothetical protein
LNKRHHDELKLENLTEKQFNTYKIIKNNAILSVNKQKTFLSDMNLYNNMNGVRFENEVEKKKKKFNELEFQVFTIKSDTLQLEKKYNMIKDTISSMMKNIKDQKIKNHSISMMNKKLLHDFLYTKINLLKIHRNFKIKSLGDIINKFNEQRLQYQSLYSQFLNLNKVIAILNIEYTDLKAQFDSLNSKIEIHWEEEKAKLLDLSDERVSKLDIRLKEVQGYNKSLLDRVLGIEKLMNNVKKYLGKYDLKISDVINSCYFAFNVEKNPFKRDSVLLGKSGSSSSTLLINSNQLKDSSDLSLIKNLIQSFLIFSNKILYVFSLVCSNISLEIYVTSPSETSVSQINENENEKSGTVSKSLLNRSLTSINEINTGNSHMNNSQSHSISVNKILSANGVKGALTRMKSSQVAEIYNIYSENILTTLDEYIIQAMFRLENKIKILSRTERDIFKDRRRGPTDVGQKDVVSRRKTNMDNIYNNFTGYLKKLGDSKNVKFLSNIQSQLIHQMQKYTNELVQTNKGEQISKRKSNLISKLGLPDDNRENRLKEYKEIFDKEHEKNIPEKKPAFYNNLVKTMSNKKELIEKNISTNVPQSKKRMYQTMTSGMNTLNDKKNSVNLIGSLLTPGDNNKKNSELEDSYISQSDQNKNEDISDKTAFGTQKKNKEMFRFYQRMDDLRNLELKYFKEGDKSVQNDKFTEIYFQFKKKYNVRPTTSPRGLSPKIRKTRTANNFSKSNERNNRQMGNTMSAISILSKNDSKIPMINKKYETISRRADSVKSSAKKEIIKNALNEIYDNEKFIQDVKSRRTASQAFGSSRYNQPFWNPNSTVTTGFNTGLNSGIISANKPGSATSDFNYNEDNFGRFGKNSLAPSRAQSKNNVKKPDYTVPSKKIIYYLTNLFLFLFAL